MINIPLEGAEDLPWGYFVLQAARGSVRVPEWVLLAIPAVVGLKVGVASDAVDGAHVDAALAMLPGEPGAALERLLVLADLDLPVAGARMRLGDDAGLGSFRDAVALVDLLHDAAVIVRSDYGADGFFACCDAVQDPERWDARGAVAAMMYLLVLLMTP